MRSQFTRLAAAAAVAAVTVRAQDDFDWTSITPTPDLEYHACYDGFQCARLEVPLNWLNASDKRTVALAMLKLPAVVADDDPKFGGSVFFNPGGPGGAGVPYGVTAAKNMRDNTFDSAERHYEFLTWDPRGIGFTTPAVDCFQGDVLARDAWIYELRGMGYLDNPNAIGYGLAMYDAFFQRCAQASKANSDILSYVNTPSVARDMVQMVDKIDELRKKEAAKKGKKAVAGYPVGADTTPRLQYYGISYGTFLGHVFGQLYPGRVGRIILDGVVNAFDYSGYPGWTKNLLDTDKILTAFFQTCFAAGPSVCPLAGNGTAAEAEAHFYEWVGALDLRPAPVVTTSGALFSVKGYDVRSIVGTVTYHPTDQFPNLAKALAAAMAGNYSTLADMVITDTANPPPVSPALSCPSADGKPAPAPALILDQLSAVACSDGSNVRDKPASWWQNYFNLQFSTSKVYGAWWTENIRFPCSSWDAKPNWVATGPFTSPKANPAVVKGLPAAGILYLTNKLDPVTPASGAELMSGIHPDSALVYQESMGHTTLLNYQGNCTLSIVHDYLNTGKLPKNGTVCQAQCHPFQDCAPAVPAKKLRRALI